MLRLDRSHFEQNFARTDGADVFSIRSRVLCASDACARPAPIAYTAFDCPECACDLCGDASGAAADRRRPPPFDALHLGLAACALLGLLVALLVQGVLDRYS